MGNIWTLVTALTDLAQVFRTQGQLQQARTLIEEALSEASQEGARSLGYISRMETSLASVLYEQNDLQAAQQLLAEAIAHIRQWPNPNHAAFTYVLQTKVQLALGDLEHACISIDEADRVRKSTVLTRWNLRMVEVELVGVWIALLTAGVRLAPGYPLAKHASALVEDWQNMLADIDSMDEGADMAALALARVALFAGRNLEALNLAQRVYKSALSAGRIGGAIESLIITAIALHRSDGVSSGKAVPSIVALEKALNLAEPGGYLRVFLDEGQPVQLLLAHWLAQAGTNPLQPYAASLLSHFGVEKHVVTATPEKVSPNNALVEPLSRRELEVLHLIALGITNQEIARQLIIAPGTVKAHTASIYRKLDVATRTEAVARARQLGILS
jgi:LuxR family maltose regulon positive regulatory protein